ncbi:MAG: hypothetical protein K2L51_01990 [Clostridiales bacterium]|nr:hypothetical protein [Clostridiales bacterium]
MTNVFSEEEKAKARRTKKRLFWSWFACLIAAVAIVLTLVLVDLYLVGEKRVRSYTPMLAFLSALVGTGFACGSLFFFAIKYRLTRKYVRMLRDMDRGLKDAFEGTFLGYEDAISMKDGVYFYSMVLKTRPLRRDDITERKLLIEQTVPKIPLGEGAKLRLVSHANIMVAYEILDAGAPAEQISGSAEISADQKGEDKSE